MIQDVPFWNNKIWKVENTFLSLYLYNYNTQIL